MSKQPVQYPFSAQELLTAIVKHKGIHEGIWAFGVRFVFTATTIELNKKPAAPSVINSIDSFYLERTENLTALSVDAAVVNPRTHIIDPFKIN